MPLNVSFQQVGVEELMNLLGGGHSSAEEVQKQMKDEIAKVRYAFDGDDADARMARIMCDTFERFVDRLEQEFHDAEGVAPPTPPMRRRLLHFQKTLMEQWMPVVGLAEFRLSAQGREWKAESE